MQVFSQTSGKFDIDEMKSSFGAILANIKMARLYFVLFSLDDILRTKNGDGDTTISVGEMCLVLTAGLNESNNCQVWMQTE